MASETRAYGLQEEEQEDEGQGNRSWHPGIRFCQSQCVSCFIFYEFLLILAKSLLITICFALARFQESCTSFSLSCNIYSAGGVKGLTNYSIVNQNAARNICCEISLRFMQLEWGDM